jgi:hypothetical protein
MGAAVAWCARQPAAGRGLQHSSARPNRALHLVSTPQVLRLDAPAGGGAQPAAGAPATGAGAAAAPASAAAAAGGALSLNQSLQGHDSAVTGVAWNCAFQKLASSDEGGLIIVWALHEGAWYEEMVNNRCGDGMRPLGGAVGAAARRVRMQGRAGLHARGARSMAASMGLNAAACGG